jgi:hypothetical protein
MSLTPDMVKSAVVRELVSELPPSHNVPQRFTLDRRNQHTIVERFRHLLIDRQTFMTDKATRPYNPPLSIEIVAYSPKRRRFIVIGRGSSGVKNLPQYSPGTPITYFGCWSSHLHVLVTEGIYLQIGADALMSFEDFGKDYLIIYHVKGSHDAVDYLNTHIRRGSN